jgi:hypothetical protein
MIDQSLLHLSIDNPMVKQLHICTWNVFWKGYMCGGSTSLQSRLSLQDYSQWRGFDFGKYAYQYHIVTKVDFYNCQRNDTT